VVVEHDAMRFDRDDPAGFEEGIWKMHRAEG